MDKQIAILHYFQTILDNDLSSEEGFNMIYEAFKTVRSNFNDSELANDFPIRLIQSKIRAKRDNKRELIKQVNKVKWGIISLSPELYEEYGHLISKTKEYIYTAPHYTFPMVFKAEKLYDILVSERVLEDKQKEVFIYYFTGQGHQPKKKLQWKGQSIYLAVLLKQLFGKQDINWETTKQVFEGEWIKNLRITLSKAKSRQEAWDKDVKKDPIRYKPRQLTYGQTMSFVRKWLTEAQ